MARRIAVSPDPEFRRRIGRAFVDALPEDARLGGCVQTSAFWLMPIRVSDPAGVINRLRAAGFDATRGATSLRALEPDQTATAKALMENVVYVPNPADLSEKSRVRLLTSVRTAIAATEK
jgi:dTDP-4-amino-4,6-dideoxygalactose transaminase